MKKCEAYVSWKVFSGSSSQIDLLRRMITSKVVSSWSSLVVRLEEVASTLSVSLEALGGRGVRDADREFAMVVTVGGMSVGEPSVEGGEYL